MDFDLRGYLQGQGFDFEPAGWALLETHFDLLLAWNRTRMNLSGLREPQAIAERHFAESLYLTKAARLSGIVYDIGSGAGFPGLPLKAAVPGLDLLLVDSSLKKTTFLSEVVKVSGVRGVRVIRSRLEEVVARPRVQLSDWVTMRAVKPHGLLPALRKLLVPRGQAALFVGADDASKLSESGGFAWKPVFHLPGSERRVILLGEALG